MRPRSCIGLSLVVSVVCAAVGCSAGKAPGTGGREPGTGGGSTGAATGQGGGPPVTGQGGTGLELIVTPTDGQDAGSDAAVDAGVCDDQSIQTYEAVPTVLLLVDTSKSMFDERAKLWDPLFNALMDPTTGVVAKLQGKVRFGFTSYKSVTRPANVTECPVLINTELKIDNYETIKAAYTMAGITPTTDYKWETPTGASVAAVAKTLAAFKPDPPGPKFILLVTDGDPDTCAVRDPQCGQDDSIKAVQDAYAAGIGTFVVGIGDILASSDTSMRVGKDHLQDLANAGTGQPVTPNSLEYSYQQCVTGGLTATYAVAPQVPGTAPYYTVSSADGTTAQTQLAAAILASLEQARSCTFNMDAQVNGDASLGTLTFNGNVLPFGDPNGWSLGADLISVSLNGSACDTWKKDGGKVNVVFPCKLVPVVHIDVPPPK
jgi:hypothetical protein